MTEEEWNKRQRYQDDKELRYLMNTHMLDKAKSLANRISMIYGIVNYSKVIEMLNSDTSLCPVEVNHERFAAVVVQVSNGWSIVV